MPVETPTLPIYSIYLRQGNRKPELKSFQFDGDLRKAIDKARDYCDKMGYRFCGCYPFLSDLDKELKAKAEGTYLPDGM